MISAKFCTFQKRINSTKRPLAADFTSVPVALKENCSLENPTFLINDFDRTWNYCLFEGSYYFITDVSFVSITQYEVYCSKDLLATYKNEIAATSCYIMYSSKVYDSKITDDRLSATHEIGVAPGSHRGALLDGDIVFYNEDMYPYIHYVSAGGNIGATSVGRITTSDLNSLIGALSLETTIQDSFATWLGNCYSAIIDLYALPFKPAIDYVIPTPSPGRWEDLVLGTIDFDGQSFTSVQVEKVDNTSLIPGGAVSTLHSEIIIPRHFNGDFRDYDANSHYVLYLPFIGNIDIDPKHYAADTYISIDCYLDCVGGNITYRVVGNSSKFTTTYNANVKCDLPLAQIQSKGLGTAVGYGMSQTGSWLNKWTGGVAGDVADLINWGGGVLGLNNTALTMTGITTLTKGKLDAWTDTISCKGGLSGSFGTAATVLRHVEDPTDYFKPQSLRTPSLTQYYYVSADDPTSSEYISALGRPLMETRTISDLLVYGEGGYIQCANASVSIEGYEEEKRIINAYMNGGFFYE